MNPRRIHVGRCQAPIVIVDDMTGALPRIVEIAAALAPFPSAAGTYYPGLRRTIMPADRAADDYVTQLLQAAAPFIGGGFDVDGFDLLDASFSMVTTPPSGLSPPQRAPHFDSPDPDHLAVLHYLSETDGTAFYRQRSTGIERVAASNLEAFVGTARREPPAPGYIAGSDDRYEEIGRVAGHPDRLVIYQGSLLHSGIIPPDTVLSPDPRRGRLTANIFVRARRN